jgi:threonine/homoserine/homoserine lactone efflux protein
MDITSGLILAFAYVATPGPITVETLRQGMKGGFMVSLAVQSGSLIGLSVYALLALFGAGLLLQDSIWQLLAGITGMVLLVYLGITTIQGGRNPSVRFSEISPGRTSPRRAFWTGAGLSLGNPLDIVFWLSIGSRVLSDPGLDGSYFLAGFFVGCLLTSLGVALFAGVWQHLLTPRMARTTTWVCGLALIAFGVKLGLSIVERYFVI